MKNWQRSILIFCIGCMLGLGIGIGGAQIVGGAILGTALDPSGAVVPGAEITVTNANTGLVRTTVTDASGLFSFPALPPGTYTLAAVISGFSREEITGIAVEVGKTAGLDVHFKLGAVSTTVSVQANTLAVETATSSVSQIISEKLMATLPLNGRNFMQLASLGSGSAPAYQSGSTEIFGLMGRNDLAVHINGRADANSMLIDGVETRGLWLGTPTILLSLDAQQEFRVQKNMFEARYGQGSATINMVTKSGTNSIHGTAYEYIRNDILDAANFFDNYFGRAKPPFRQNQYGVSVGGPIRRDKLFYFGNYEAFRIRQGNTLTGLYPTPEQLKGDLRGLSSSKKDPVTGLPAILNPFTGQAFPNSQIPDAMISSIVKKFNKYIPTPNANIAGINFIATPSTVRDDDQFTGRIDFNLSNSDTLFGRYVYFNSDLLQPGIAQYYGKVLPLSGQNLAIQETHTFAKNLVNVFKFGYNRDRIFLSWENTPTSVVSELGIKNLKQVPVEYGLPNFSAVTYSGFGGQSSNQGAIDNVFQFTDEMSWFRGRHSLSFGADIRRIQYQQRYALRSNGNFAFDGRYSGNPLADYLLGTATSAVAQQQLAQANWRSTSLNFFVQDDFKITPRLTMNIGLRYEYDSPFYETQGKEGYFDTTEGRMIVRLDPKAAPYPMPETLVRYDPGYRKGIWKPDRNNWAPRLGIAYRLADKTVLRGGAGIFYSKAQGQEMQGKVNFPPLVVTNTLTGSLTIPDLLIDRDCFPDPSSITVTTVSPFSVDPNDRTPYMNQWNLNLQHSFGKSDQIEIAYVGSQGFSLDERVQVNQATLPDPANPTPIAQRRPYKSWGDILSFNYPDKSNYHGMQTRYDWRPGGGFNLLAAYTWSHAIDTASRGGGGTQHQTIYNRNGDRGNADFDLRHRFVVSYSYELPLGQGKRLMSGANNVVNKIIGGWSINGISNFMTGNYRSISVSGDRANTGGFAAQRANLLSGAQNHGNYDRGDRTILKYFDTSAYAVTMLGTYGNSGRNIIETPGLNLWDLSLFKMAKVTEQISMQFRCEFFNAWNHPQFDAPALSVQSQFFGQIRSAKPARQIQFALRLMW